MVAKQLVLSAMYASDKEKFKEAEKTFLSSVEYSAIEPEKRPLIMGRVI